MLQRVEAFFFETQMPGHGRESSELFSFLQGLPHREEVEGGRDFRGAPLSGGTRDLDLRGCNFTYARLTLNLVNCDLREVVFDDVAGGNGIILDRLDGARFVRAKLRGAFFQKAQARQCCFDNASLAGASFEGADLTGSSFRNADCRRAKFLRAKLVGCDLRGAVLDEAVLQDVKLDETTDMRGASLLNVYDRALHDQAGNLVAPATDWRRARVDATTVYGHDGSSSARELIDAILLLLAVDSRPWAASAAEELHRARETATDNNEWYTGLLRAVGPEARPEVEALVSDAMRSLL
jgi:uncharacterized protein YjbI with pentapeptide repeats